MNEMNILTLNGTQYEIADKKAREEVAGKASKAYADKTFAPAIPVTMTGTTVSTDMVSPVEHEVECKVSGVDDLTAVAVKQRGENQIPFPFPDFPVGTSGGYSGVKFTALPDGGIHIKGKTSKSVSKIIYKQAKFGSGEISSTDGSYEATNGEFAISKYLYYSPSKGLLVNVYPKGVETTYDEVIYPFAAVGSHIDSLVTHPSPDGTVSGMKSISPSMTILTDNPDATVTATYNADTKRYIDNKFAELQSAILSTGGNV